MRGTTPKGGSMPPPPTYKPIDVAPDQENGKKKQPVILPPPPNSKNLLRMNSGQSSGNCKFLQFVGPSCGHHASYTFYKAAKYLNKNGQTKILSLGEFFFVKIWHDSDIISIGELQLLWEDKNSNQILTSLRLYFLPEYTPDGRTHFHGEDELVAVAEKAVLRVTDLLDWIANPKDVNWDRGLLGVCESDCKSVPPSMPNYDKGLNAKFSPGFSDFLNDVKREKAAIGDILDVDDAAVIVLSIPQYSRYRAVLKRIAGKEKQLMHNSLIAALGGFTTPTRKTRVLFCREIFDYAELEEHPFLCNHLAPKLKGRPRKRKKVTRPGSPGSESGSSESSVATSNSTSVSTSASAKNSPRNGLRKDLLSILSQKNTKEELDFLKKLVNFMERRNTPIERPPMLGYKQIDLHLFFEKVKSVGGYDGCTKKKTWKMIYDDLGGNPVNTSAATCTRKHYERFLLPFERYLRGHGDKKIKRKEMADIETDPKSEVDQQSAGLEGIEEEEEEMAEGNPPPVNLIQINKKDEMKEDLENDLKSGKFLGESLDKIESDKKDSEDLSDAMKANPLLGPGLQSLMGHKPDSQMRIDPDGKRLQIDDLIIIPNNLHSPPEGGSALKSLAQIASRYQSGVSSASGMPATDGSSPKKPRLDDGKIPNSGSSPALPSAMNLGQHRADGASPLSSSATQQQNSLFSVFPGGLLPGSWPPSVGIPAGSKTSTNTTNSTSTKLSTSASASSAMNSALALAAAAAAAGLSNFPLSSPDPTKLGSEGYSQLIQFYEKHLKSAAASAAQTTATAAPATVKQPSVGLNGSKKEAAGQSSALSAKDKDRQKVSKPPPDTKRPPRLMQTPCAFVQTNHIYTNPMAELTKAKEAVLAATANAAARDKLPMGAGTIETQLSRAAHPTSILDLSSHRRVPPKSEHQPTTGLLNLKKESALLAHPHSSASSINLMGLNNSMKREGLMSSSSMSHPLGFSGSGSSPSTGSSPSLLKHEMKSSPFSAESLLSKSSSSSNNKSSYSSHLQHSMSDLVKMSERSKQDAAMSRLSPAAPLSSLSLPRTSPAPHSSSFTTSHSPLSTGHDKSRNSPWHTPVSQGGGSQKPAIPVSPVVRESEASKKESLASFQSALFGLSYPPTTTSTNTPMSMSLPPTTFSLSPSASSLVAAQQSFAAAAAANPYLALMSMGSGLPQVSSSSQMSAAMSKSLASSFSPHLMDPATSAYYAALYSQQMYGLSPYFGAPGSSLRPSSMTAPSSSSGSSQAAATAAMAAAAAGLDPLQASALQAMLSRGSGSAPSPTNPYAGFPGGIPGFPGYPSFPPQSGRKDS